MPEIEAFRDHLLRLRGSLKFELVRAQEQENTVSITMATAQINLLDMVIRDYERLLMRQAPLPTTLDSISDFVGDLP